MSVRVAVVGNCQAIGVADCLRRLCPDIEVVSHSWGSIAGVEQANALAKELQACDLVFSQFTKRADYGDLRTARLRELCPRTLLFPKVIFTGFHPDMIAMEGVYSPLGVSHSGLILTAQLLGVPVGRVADLFNAYVYAVAGYFEEFAKAETYLLQSAAVTDAPLDDALPEWRTRGIFVHVPSHPTVQALSSIAEMLALKAELAPRIGGDLPPDRLADSVVWPLYPEIGARLGVEGGLRFKPTGVGAAAIELDEMIERSYRAYAGCDQETLRTPRAVELAEALRAEGI